MTNLAIPILLASIVMIAGVFAFMPIDKASTVHTTIGTNIDNQNRAVNFAVNMTSGQAFQIIPAETGVTLSGSYVLSSVPAPTSAELVVGVLECGLTDGGTGLLSDTNSTETASANGTLAAAELQAGEGIVLHALTETDAKGTCQVTIVLDGAGG